jgi:sarcosine oxidase
MAAFDAIVVGLGAVGSAATHYLAKSGARVLGIDRFTPPHSQGSSHGDTRITRAAIGEGVEYSALALRSHALWRAMEAETGQRLFVRCGCLTISGRNAAVMHDVEDFFGNIGTAATRFGISHRTFESPAEIRAAFPQFAVREGDRAILDAEAGYLLPETCIAAHLQLAARHGARLATDTEVTGINSDSDGAEVRTATGETHKAGRVLIAAGAWLPGFLGSAVARHFTVTRQVLHWFEIRTNAKRFRDTNCPVFIWQLPREGNVKSSIYGFPLFGDVSNGIKVTHEESGGVADPDRVDRTVPENESDRVYRTYVEPFFPDLGSRCMRTETCLYTRVDRSRFVIDRVPGKPRVTFVSACSGHGFKHSAAIGEALADEITQGRAAHVDLEPFRLERLAAYLRK